MPGFFELAKALRAKAERAKARGRKVVLEPTPPGAWPKSLERRYEKEINVFVKAMDEITRKNLFPKLSRIVDEFKRTSGRFDDYSDDISTTLSGIKVQYLEEVPTETVEAVAQDQATSVNAYGSKVFQDQVKSVAGINIFTDDRWLKPAVKSFISNNVALIRSISDDYFKDIESLLYTSLEAGKTNKEIERLIVERTGVSKSRARLIARDQTGKFYSNCNAKRATSIGVEKYRWSTSMDERVRSSHQEVSNKIFTYQEGAVIDGRPNVHPGQDIQCRCVAIPILASIIEGETDAEENFED